MHTCGSQAYMWYVPLVNVELSFFYQLLVHEGGTVIIVDEECNEAKKISITFCFFLINL